MEVAQTLCWQSRLRGILGSLGAQERRFAEYLLNRLGGIEKEPIAVLAREAQVSEATVVRVCHKMGYAGLKELKIAVARENRITGAPTAPLDEELAQLREKVFEGTIRSIRDTSNMIDGAVLEEVTKVLCQANYITIYGLGASAPVARNLKHQLMQIGIPAIVDSEIELSTLVAGKYGKGDVAIGISYSGESAKVVDAIKIAKGKGTETICITSFGDSALARCSDLRLFTSAETLPDDKDKSLARSAQIYLINLLCMNMALKYDRYHDA